MVAAPSPKVDMLACPPIAMRRGARPSKCWRAWLTGVGAALLAWFALAVIVFALVGVAISVGVVLLLLIPAIVIVSVVSSLMRKEI